jgi:group II intron reverse transcriptase/maturase
MSTSLERIAVKARKDKKHRFQNLSGMLDRWFLWNQWKNLNKKAAVGVDKVTHTQYGDNLMDNLIDLEGRLKRKAYRAKLVRRHYIPKGGGKMRPLGIPAIEDKLVQNAVTQILQAIFEQDFLPSSYGYRPSRGSQGAVENLRHALDTGNYQYVVEADIKGYFDNLDHDWLVRMLEQRIDDKPFIRLIRKWLKAGVLETDGQVIHPATGSPQGGIISPMLANIYMHFVLNLWFEHVVKVRCRGKAEVFVYADDFVCLFERAEEAKAFYSALGKRMAKFGLELSSEKTNIIDFRRYARQKFDFLGFEFRWMRSRTRKVQIRTSKKKFQKSCQAFKDWCKKERFQRITTLIRKLNAKLRGYYEYYGLWGNYRSLHKFFYYVNKTLFRWLNRRSQKRSYTWEGFNKMLKECKIVKPKVKPRAVVLTNAYA